MRTKREIKQLRKEVQAIKEDLRVMKYERGLDVTAEQAVYDDLNATQEQLEALKSAVEPKAVQDEP